MAATCLDIITYAMRQCKIVGIGKDPKAAEAEEGLSALQSLYDQWRTGGMFGTLEDVYLTADDTAEEGKRYYVPADVVLTAPTSEYVDACGITRQPRDMALYEALTSAGTLTAKLYDRTGWVDLTGLTLTSIAPLGARNARGLAACLATAGGLSDIFGEAAQPGPATIALSRHFLRNVMSKGGSTQDIGGVDYF